MEKIYRIGLFVRIYENLGNQATLLAAIQNLRERLPKAELLALTENPAKTSFKFNIESFPIQYKNISQTKNAKTKKITDKSKNVKVQPLSIFHITKSLVPRQIKDLVTLKTKLAVSDFFQLLSNVRDEIRFIRQARERLDNLDAIMICGTGPLQDFLGPWNYPYTIFKWVLMAKATNTKVFFVSVGVGPPTHNLSCWFYKKALIRADYLSYRNGWCKKIIEDRIGDFNGLVYPDLVHKLKIKPSRIYHQKKQKIVAINPMRVFESSAMEKGNRSQYDYYLYNMVEFINYILSKGFSVKLFNSSDSDLLTIDAIIEQLKLEPKVNMDKVSVVENETVQGLFDTISEADLIVATRFHSSLIPLQLGKPVISLCYHQKSKELFQEIGLGDYYVDVNNFNWEELSAKFDLLIDNVEDVKRLIEKHQKNYEELLDEQWENLVNLIKN